MSGRVVDTARCQFRTDKAVFAKRTCDTKSNQDVIRTSSWRNHSVRWFNSNVESSTFDSRFAERGTVSDRSANIYDNNWIALIPKRALVKR